MLLFAVVWNPNLKRLQKVRAVGPNIFGKAQENSDSHSLTNVSAAGETEMR